MTLILKTNNFDFSYVGPYFLKNQKGKAPKFLLWKLYLLVKDSKGSLPIHLIVVWDPKYARGPLVIYLILFKSLWDFLGSLVVDFIL